MKIWWQSSTPIHKLHDYRKTLDRASRCHQTAGHRDPHQRRRQRLDGPALQRDRRHEQLRAGRRAQQDDPGRRERLRRHRHRLLPRSGDAGSARGGADPGVRAGRDLDAGGLHVRPQVFRRRLPRQAGAILRPQGLRIRPVVAPRPVRRPRHRFQRGTERVHQPGPDARALHQRSRGVWPHKARK